MSRLGNYESMCQIDVPTELIPLRKLAVMTIEVTDDL
jgi:hypothetical protein